MSWAVVARLGTIAVAAGGAVLAAIGLSSCKEKELSNLPESDGGSPTRYDPPSYSYNKDLISIDQTGSLVPKVLLPPDNDCCRFEWIKGRSTPACNTSDPNQIKLRRPARINFPDRELEQLEKVTTRIDAAHADNIKNKNYEPVREDPVLRRLLLPPIIDQRNVKVLRSGLQGLEFYLMEGTQFFLDTESDVMNLRTAREWLLQLKHSDTAYADNPLSKGATEAWENKSLRVELPGFWFRDNEVPHNNKNGQENVSADTEQPRRFRIVTPITYDEIPVLKACGIRKTDVSLWWVDKNKHK